MYLDFKYHDVNELKSMARFFGMTPMTGLNTFNNLIKRTNRKVSADHWSIHWITQRIALRQMNVHFRRIRREDTIIDSENLDSYTEEEINSICIQRGIEV